MWLSSGFQSDPLEVVTRASQNSQQNVGLARNFHFLQDLARLIHNADARVLDRYVQSRKIFHAALLLLMLEADTNLVQHQLEAHSLPPTPEVSAPS
jgi:hypothetical protein